MRKLLYIAALIATPAMAQSVQRILDPATVTIAGALNSPIPAQSGQGVDIGATENFARSGASVTWVPQTGATAAISVSTATTTQIIPLAASKAIYVTAWDIVVAGADNVTLEYGTGSNCGTGTTALTGPYNLGTNGGISKGTGFGAVLIVPAGNALCAVTSAAVQASGSVSYAQY